MQSCGLIRDGLFTYGKFRIVFHPQLCDLQFFVLASFSTLQLCIKNWFQCLWWINEVPLSNKPPPPSKLYEINMPPPPPSPESLIRGFTVNVQLTASRQWGFWFCYVIVALFVQNYLRGVSESWLCCRAPTLKTGKQEQIIFFFSQLHVYLPILAMGNPHWRISTTASTADLTSGNEDTPDAV